MLAFCELVEMSGIAQIEGDVETSVMVKHRGTVKEKP